MKPGLIEATEDGYEIRNQATNVELGNCKITHQPIFNYGLTDGQKAIVIGMHGWCRLSYKEPATGQHCEFIVLHPDFCSEIETGKWVDKGVTFIGNVQASYKGFSTDKGVYISDPKHTYWRPNDEG
jgi:hypothetical protein